MKVFDIAIKDLTSSMRSKFALVFMFGVPLLVTGMFYFMFGNIASQGEFSLPQIHVVIANLDEGGPKFQTNTRNIPGGAKADTMGELVVNILQSDDLAELLDARLVPDAACRQSSCRQPAGAGGGHHPRGFLHPVCRHRWHCCH